jgi:hypothetical protein
MKLLFRAAVVLPLVAWFSAHATAQAHPSIRKVEVLRTTAQVEIEVEASDRVIPQTNLLRNPDRLVVDFVNAVPGTGLHNQAVNRAEVKNLRVGLFSANPPVTRIVLDLSGPQPYQVFPEGRTVIVKVGAAPESAAYHPGPGPVLTNANYSATNAHLSVESAPAPRPALAVSFRDGMLTINANKANLSEVLFAVHQRTGAEIAIPAGAEQEQVVVELGPAPAPEVLSRLLNGSKFNFLILNSPSDPRILDRVILSSRPEGPMPAPSPQRQMVAQDDEEDGEPQQTFAGTQVHPAPGIPPAPNANFDATNPNGQPGDPNSAEKKPADNNDD